MVFMEELSCVGIDVNFVMPCCTIIGGIEDVATSDGDVLQCVIDVLQGGSGE